MSNQYFVADGMKRGPLSAEKVLELARTEQLAADTLVFEFGGWRRLADSDRFRDLFPNRSPDPSHGNASKRSGPHARLLARVIDVVIIASLILSLIRLIFRDGTHPPTGTHNILDLYLLLPSPIVLPIVCLSISLLMTVIGTTPGKALLGIRVRQLMPSSRPRFYLTRVLKIWAFVFCFGVQIAALMQISRQYRLVRLGNSTVYDEGSAVVEGQPSRFRFAGGIVALLLSVPLNWLVMPLR